MARTVGGESDYGSDFSAEEEYMVEQLVVRQPLEDDNPIVNEPDNHDPQRTLRLPRILEKDPTSSWPRAPGAAEKIVDHTKDSLWEAGAQSPSLSSRIEERLERKSQGVLSELAPVELDAPDTRSPLERFRTHPKKALSVTDLVSPAWCELQYWYTLTIHGRKKRTPAMKQGSAVHKALEDQVHMTVKVDIESKEDAWGLRIWNVIQGLRTLRYTGLTRELEVWGVVDGFVVNGVIDELTYTCPDDDLEQSLHGPSPTENPNTSDESKTSGGLWTTKSGSCDASAANKRTISKEKVYLCDVKTRSVRTLPSGSAFRPTKMQLLLYRSLLSALAADSVDFSVLVSRFALDSSKVFSDAFIAQVDSLSQEMSFNPPYTSESSQEVALDTNQDFSNTLLAHNNLADLWALMINEFRLALPNGADSVGKILKAEYRSRDAGEVIGMKTFIVDEDEIAAYLNHEMEWWKGKREPEGVVIEEAFKCRSCEFADNCTWRLRKVDEAKEKVRLARKRTGIV